MNQSNQITSKKSSSSVRSVRSKGEKWSQVETETLASLCVEYGREGILSKEINKATVAKKDSQWEIIKSLFNAVHVPREKNALIARYKVMLMQLRKNNALQRRNIIETGGSPRDMNLSKSQFEFTGSLQELANALGVSITGLVGYGSDRQELQTTSQSQQAINNCIEEYLPRLNKRRNVDNDNKNERRKAAKHSAEMAYEKFLMEAKLKEIKENKMDRQLERERRAELHKMTTRQQESLFEIQKEVLLAQRDAFKRCFNGMEKI